MQTFYDLAIRPVTNAGEIIAAGGLQVCACVRSRRAMAIVIGGHSVPKSAVATAIKANRSAAPGLHFCGSVPYLRVNAMENNPYLQQLQTT